MSKRGFYLIYAKETRFGEPKNEYKIYYLPLRFIKFSQGFTKSLGDYKVNYSIGLPRKILEVIERSKPKQSQPKNAH